jgi:hypothetical protein
MATVLLCQGELDFVSGIKKKGQMQMEVSLWLLLAAVTMKSLILSWEPQG